MRQVRISSEACIYIRNQFINKYGLKRSDIEISETAEFDLVGHTICHNNNERFYFSFRDHVVHNKISMPLITPCRFIFAPPMLQVQYGITILYILFIPWWGIHKRSA